MRARVLIVLCVVAVVAAAWWYFERRPMPATLPVEPENPSFADPAALGMMPIEAIITIPAPTPPQASWRQNVVNAARALAMSVADAQRIAPGYPLGSRLVNAARIERAAPDGTKTVLKVLLLGVPPFPHGAASRSPVLAMALAGVNASRDALAMALDAPYMIGAIADGRALNIRVLS